MLSGVQKIRPTNNNTCGNWEDRHLRPLALKNPEGLRIKFPDLITETLNSYFSTTFSATQSMSHLTLQPTWLVFNFSSNNQSKRSPKGSLMPKWILLQRTWSSTHKKEMAVTLAPPFTSLSGLHGQQQLPFQLQKVNCSTSPQKDHSVTSHQLQANCAHHYP